MDLKNSSVGPSACTQLLNYCAYNCREHSWKTKNESGKIYISLLEATIIFSSSFVGISPEHIPIHYTVVSQCSLYRPLKALQCVITVVRYCSDLECPTTVQKDIIATLQ